MASALRRPFAVTSALRHAIKPTTSPANTLRQFHQTPSKRFKFFPSRSTTPITAFAQSKNAFQTAFRRYASNSATPATNAGNKTQQLVYGLGLIGGGALALNIIFNRETREDGGMPPYERSYLNDTFMHTGLGIGIIAVAATALHRSGWSVRLMTANPWLVFGVGLVGSIGTMMGTRMTPPENYIPKYALWTGFNVTQAMLLSPLLFLHPALLGRAALYTVGMMGSIAFVGATAKQEKYLYLGAPLLGGLAIVALSGLAPLVVPATAVRTLMWTENIWLYGGLAVFGGFTLYDVQKVLHHARMAERGLMKRDAVNEAISLELDFINIFIRMVQILGMQQRRK
ncbi:hypothetical protein K402DRAFT_397480 [Aulographum hederae CBS 113979]|uniref:Bax inhibitor family protein n=1 Tax=Aulographum hederae CBS 113979 TaxID=1176131 RepID=A0A6G1GPB0_9PEZI|nr:hypothetical protein K402DRAFT_397480 [Aulographum hederae CBS 113979]